VPGAIIAAVPRKAGGVPTVLRRGPSRFFFYAADRHDPRRVHVEREAMRAKFWLDPVRLAESGGFSRIEIRGLQVLVERNARFISRRRDEFFGS